MKNRSTNETNGPWARISAESEDRGQTALNRQPDTAGDVTAPSIRLVKERK